MPELNKIKYILLVFTFLAFNTITIFGQSNDTLLNISFADIVLDGWRYDMGNISATRYCKGALCNGEFIDTFPNGKVQSKSFLIEGKAHGHYERYFENGQLMMRGAWEHGERVGLWEFYYENGQLEFEATYSIKYFYPRTAIHYFENGNIALKSAYSDEDLMLYQHEFYENGTKETSIELIDIKELIYEEIRYHSNGQIRERGKFREVDGSWKVFGTWSYYDTFGVFVYSENLGEF